MITHLPQFISVDEYAKRNKLTMRTTRDHIRKKKISYEKIGGFDMIAVQVPENSVAFEKNKLVWVQKFAILNKYAPDTIYENIIKNKINAFVVGDRVFVNTEDDSVITFLKNNPPKKTG
jgi:hypothetical protein